jgi:glutamate N-acetyltransferase/amino-acid N-acetyltransferase
MTELQPIDIEPILPEGVRLMGGHTGVKAARLDTALLISDAPMRAVGTFTQNRCAAACVLGNRPLLPSDKIRTLTVISGNANCYAEGDVAADVMLRKASAALAVATPDTALTATTGPIGVPLDARKVAAGLPRVFRLPASVDDFADAILTTDTVRKVACVRWQGATFLGIAKGSGMIHPDMATMIAVCVTDADVPLEAMQNAIKTATSRTFNAITVDRDTSTNDSAFFLSTAKGPQVADPLPALTAVFQQLAVAIARDGEGATRLCAVRVHGAPDEACARTSARDVAGSDLVKSALFACDPNWGRIAAALGASLARQGAEIARDDVTIRLMNQVVFPISGPLDKAGLSAAMRSSDTLTVDVCIGQGAGDATAWGCDLTYDYVRINAEAPVSYGQNTPVRASLEMQTLTPVLKKGVLREALRYLHDFDRKTMVILVQAEAPTTDDDLALLRLTGIRPIVLRNVVLEVAVSVARDNEAMKIVVLSAEDGIRDSAGKIVPEQKFGTLPQAWRADGLADFLERGGTLHVLNGQVHAALIEELFTDRGIGSMVTG